jgi:transcriptional regulator with XRE-family HTH domain
MQSAIAPRISPVGQLLREWRTARGMSQLDLAMHTGFSTRHVSFIETGRTQPSRQALLDLADTLEVPLRERNRLLEAAGYAQYRQTPLDADEMRHIRGVLQFILDRPKPYATIVLDRYSNCLMGNPESAALLAAVVDPSLIVERANILRMVFHPLGAQRYITNWTEVARHLLSRAERELGEIRGDAAAEALLEELRGYVGPVQEHRTSPLRPADILLPVAIKKGDLELRLFSTIMTLGTPQDVTLQELRIETFFPADEASEQLWRCLNLP